MEVISGLVTHHSPVAVGVGVLKEGRSLSQPGEGPEMSIDSVEGKTRSVTAM